MSALGPENFDTMTIANMKKMLGVPNPRDSYSSYPGPRERLGYTYKGLSAAGREELIGRIKHALDRHQKEKTPFLKWDTQARRWVYHPDPDPVLHWGIDSAKGASTSEYKVGDIIQDQFRYFKVVGHTKSGRPQLRVLPKVRVYKYPSNTDNTNTLAQRRKALLASHPNKLVQKLGRQPTNAEIKDAEAAFRNALASNPKTKYTPLPEKNIPNVDSPGSVELFKPTTHYWRYDASLYSDYTPSQNTHSQQHSQQHQQQHQQQHLQPPQQHQQPNTQPNTTDNAPNHLHPLKFAKCNDRVVKGVVRKQHRVWSKTQKKWRCELAPR